MKLEVVYFAYLKKEWDIFYEQMDYFISNELYHKADKLNLCCTINEEDIPKIEKVILERYPKWIISNISTENNFEYPGIGYLHDIAQEDTLYLYFHTKGIFNFVKENKKLRKSMQDHLINNYKACIGYIEEGYDKVSCYKSHGGFCWFNFLWVTGKFLLGQPKPKSDPPDRCYYEEWFKGNPDKVKSLIIEQPVIPHTLLVSIQE